jgi:hypothetical protein
MSLIKITNNAKVKLEGKTLFNTPLSEENGGGFVSPLDTTIYNPDGTLYDTEGNPLNGNVPDSWKSGAKIAGYVDIGTSANSIGSSAFGYNQLTSVTIPDSVTDIGTSAFRNNQLSAVTIPNSVTIIGSSAFQNNQLSAVTIGNSVTIIGSGAFNSNRLISVTIGNSVTIIGNTAFRSNLLTSVTISESVTSIESSAFRLNPSLSVVNCYTTQTAFVGTNIFQSTALPLTIHARATDETWTAGGPISFQGNSNVTVIKDL